MFSRQPPSPPPSNDGEMKPIFRDLPRSYQYPYTQNQQQTQQGTIYKQEPLSYGLLEVDESEMAEKMKGESTFENAYRNGQEGNCVEDAPVAPLSYVRTSQLGVPGTGMASARARNTGSGIVKTEPTTSPNLREDKIRVSRPAKVRKRVKRNSDKEGSVSVVPGPLSILTKDMTHIPVRDMEAWVNRPIEERRKEVSRKNGKIARPMNSFLLYRSAYTERIKEYYAQKNHQIVSKASGESWSVEPSEVRDMFERFAKIERRNHEAAHPGYKFTPNKNKNAGKKKKSGEEEDEDDDSSIPGENGFDATSFPHPNGRKHLRHGSGDSLDRTPTPGEHDSCYDSRQSTPFHHADPNEAYLNPDPNRPWEPINANRPLFGMLSPPDQTHYFQPSIQQSLIGQNIIEDVTYKKMGMPNGINYEAAGTLAGLSSSAQPELFRPQSHPNGRTPVSMADVQVDPQLLEFESSPSAPLIKSEGTSYGSQADIWQFPPSQGNPQYMQSSAEQYRPHYQPHLHTGLQQTMPHPMSNRDMLRDAAALQSSQAGQEYEDYDWFSGPPIG